MTVPFAQIPAGDAIRVPLFYAEIDPSQANTAQLIQRALIIGQKTSAGTYPPNLPVLVQSVTAGIQGGGAGSLLADMIKTYRLNDTFGELWALPLVDDGAAVAATGSISFTGPTTAVGVLSLYVAGQKVSIALASGTTAAQAATAVAAAINAATALPVTAAVDGTTTSKVNVTAKNAGATGLDIDMRVGFRGAPGGERTPAGLGVTIVAMTGGATPPSLTAALANLQDEPFDFIVSPYNDPTTIAAITAFLNDSTGRWSWQTQVYGHCFIAKRGSQGALATFGNGLNDQHLSCMGIYDSPSPSWEWAAAMAGAAAVSVRADPGLPLQTLALRGVLAPHLGGRFSLSQRNTLLFDGISTFSVASDDTPLIENVITTYQFNALGDPDNSYVQVETMFLLMYVLRQLSTVITTKYARKKLKANGTRIAPGSNVVTPNTIRADLIAKYSEMEEQGYVQQSDTFAENLVVEKNATAPNRVDVLYPAILIDQLRIFALLMQFRLQ
ncbi:phage tail sheath subtilisin-like domain-containing protein [Flavisphingomonas formosensis]|uniref:phage tail sheath subtilisin-like domain-containing protein n=1 Tax=Flavisphingomonas formosensis TaxID=861534 RepID=UPI0012F71C6A|nr:phage tail sheath subtilisin-like domain-containing protein [Sphingomonas formosensis]